MSKKTQNTMENIFKRFNEDFFKSSKLKIQWFDKEGVIRFTDFIIRLTIDNVGTFETHYNGYMVEVVHKTNGSICKKFFRFSDHLEMIHRENTQEYFHVWYDRGEFEWYISKPKDTKPMIDVIERWYLTIIS